MAALVATLATGCSSGQAASVTDPSTVAQASARLLQRGKAPGFNPFGMQRLPRVHYLSKAKPFVPPHGSPDEVCTRLITPALFAPTPSINGGEDIGVAHPRRYMPFTPSWMEWVDVYPGTEAAGIVKALSALIGNCGHFDFQVPRNSGVIPVHEPVHEAVAPLRGLGNQALYVSVRLLPKAPGFATAEDWIVIRSDRTLIWIIGQYVHVRPAGNTHDRMTLQLAREAWRHYSAG